MTKIKLHLEMIIIKNAISITLQRVCEIILNITLFGIVLNLVNVTLGIHGFILIFISIYINDKARKFVFINYSFYKNKYFSKNIISTFEFDRNLLEGHDLSKIFSSNSSIAVGESLLSIDEIKSIRSDFTQLKNDMGNHLFTFIFKSATQSSLITFVTIILSDYMKLNYGVSVFNSVSICISLSFIISFVSSLNYTKALLKEWNELLDEIENNENINSNRRHILYIYGGPKSQMTAKNSHKNEPSSDVTSKSSGSHERKRDKQVKSQSEEPNEKDIKKTSKQILVGLVSNEIENEELLKTSLMLLDPKFSANASDILENFFVKYNPRSLMSTQSQTTQNGTKNMTNNVGNLVENFFVLSQLNKISESNPFFSLKTLKECSVRVTDYYDVGLNLTNYLKHRGFKLFEKWAEYNMFLFIKFKAYEYRKSLTDLDQINFNVDDLRSQSVGIPSPLQHNFEEIDQKNK